MANVIDDITYDLADNFTGSYGREGWSGVVRKAKVIFSNIDDVDSVLADIVDALGSGTYGAVIKPWRAHPDIISMFVDEITPSGIDETGFIFDVDINYARLKGDPGSGDPDDPTSYAKIDDSATIVQEPTSYDAAGNEIEIEYTDSDGNVWTKQPGTVTVDVYYDTVTVTWLSTTNLNSDRVDYLNTTNVAAWTPPGRSSSWAAGEAICTQWTQTRQDEDYYQQTVVFVNKSSLTTVYYIDQDTGKPPTNPLPSKVAVPPLPADNGVKDFQMYNTAAFSGIPFPAGI